MTGHKANAFESYRAETMRHAITLYRNSPAGQKRLFVFDSLGIEQRWGLLWKLRLLSLPVHLF
jgi:hypothetical protein